MSTVTARLDRLGLTLPAAPKPVAAYVPAVRTGNLVFISGQIPLENGQLIASGSVPSAVPMDLARPPGQSRQTAIPDSLPSFAGYSGPSFPPPGRQPEGALRASAVASERRVETQALFDRP